MIITFRLGKKLSVIRKGPEMNFISKSQQLFSNSSPPNFKATKNSKRGWVRWQSTGRDEVFQNTALDILPRIGTVNHSSRRKEKNCHFLEKLEAELSMICFWHERALM